MSPEERRAALSKRFPNRFLHFDINGRVRWYCEVCDRRGSHAFYGEPSGCGCEVRNSKTPGIYIKVNLDRGLTPEASDENDALAALTSIAEQHSWDIDQNDDDFVVITRIGRGAWVQIVANRNGFRYPFGGDCLPARWEVQTDADGFSLKTKAAAYLALAMAIVEREAR